MSGTDDSQDEELLDSDHDSDIDGLDDDAHASDAIAEVNEWVAKHWHRATPSTTASASACPIVVRPSLPEPPRLTPLPVEEIVTDVVNEFLPGDVLLIGRKELSSREAKPYVALLVAEDVAHTVRQLLVMFDAITESGAVPYWKLNPYRRDAVESYSGIKLSERWSGRPTRAKVGTWVDEHIARIGFLSGDHDVGRSPEDAKAWENALAFDDALERYWVKIQMMCAGPMPTFMQDSGRGFSPIWQLSPGIVYDSVVKQEVKAILTELRNRAKGLAVDDGIYVSVNPFMKAPGAIHPKSGRTITFSAIEGNLYTVGDFQSYYDTYKPWTIAAKPTVMYLDDPVKRKPRRVSESSKAAHMQRLGPSYAVLGDLQKLLEHWNYNLTGRSNAFFRAYAWHRRNILMTEVGVEAHMAGEQLVDVEYIKRVMSRLSDDMDDLNVNTGERIDETKMNSYIKAKFPKEPQPTSAWASDLGVDSDLSRLLGLKTILPEDERRERDEAKDRQKKKRESARNRKNIVLDKMIMSGEKYAYSVYTKEQVEYRRKKLIESGVPVPKRRAGRPKK